MSALDEMTTIRPAADDLCRARAVMAEHRHLDTLDIRLRVELADRLERIDQALALYQDGPALRERVGGLVREGLAALQAGTERREELRDIERKAGL